MTAPFIPDLTAFANWVPLFFVAMMGLAMLAYVVLDGYDLGVGMLLLQTHDAHNNKMIASIGPFWDANETWLVLGIGILLTVFPGAHGIILGKLYLPVALMLIGLIVRGVAFEFRIKAVSSHQRYWNYAFWLGSSVASLAQGWMLGNYILGFQTGVYSLLFSALIALCLAATYCLLGSTWLIMKNEGELQLLAVKWARKSLLGMALGVAAISLVSPWVSELIYRKWLTFPNVLWLAPLPLVTIGLLVLTYRSLRQMPARLARGDASTEWIPFAATAAIMTLAFLGLAYSLFPFLVIDQVTIWQAVIAYPSQVIILVGALLVLPVILGYTFFTWRVFKGKTKELHYI